MAKSSFGAGIATNLLRFAKDEGIRSALNKAENWRDSLEEMAEIANTPQQNSIELVLVPIKYAISLLVKRLEDRS